ncbi:MAG: hypothetical protein JWR05_1719 [Mucilaginibacter sp.]|nr:hypothetical protein [Mucilaginibacter sp.]
MINRAVFNVFLHKPVSDLYIIDNDLFSFGRIWWH